MGTSDEVSFSREEIRMKDNRPTRDYFNQFNTGQLQRQITVRNYDDLVNAISTLIRNYSVLTNSLPYLGYEIIIADSIICPRKIILPIEVSGVTIRGLGRVQILPHNDGNVDCLFDIQGCLALTIKDLNVCSVGTYFNTFVTVSSYTPHLSEIDAPVIANNLVRTQTLYSESLGNVDYAQIINNKHSRPDSGALCLTSTSDKLLVQGNNFGGNDLYITGQYSRVVANNMNGGDIDTSVGANSYVVANTNATTTLSGTDIFL
jgi:hypothetical protein